MLRSERVNGLTLLSTAVVAFGALPAPAHAALTAAGAIDPATNAPAFYQDANGLQLGLCHPGTPNCGPAVAGEDFYYMATSTFTAPNGGTASLILNMTLAPNASGDPAAFNRVRVQLDGFPAGTWTITHPYARVHAPARRTAHAQRVSARRPLAQCLRVLPCARRGWLA